ncbi:3-oxoadipate enol-lactonase [Albidovulum sediminis]|uniref:3-oxoadipate enol-lactonase n=1 Tax=Albidovulum sediminis TaxID=3066345 RepID=A0ABT2NJY7_9RHOB|nr:3-oxoadipate enol-lactonase [Defluviimonas sediminis]MCT8328393.1 3-oxoadipate enol-lactonase [Defluviimonas sediminis]
MNILDLGDTHIHWREDGDLAGAPVVFSHALGSDLRMWDKIVPLMPAGLRLIRYDTRGHGLSACPAGPYAMGALIRDAERLLEALDIRDCAFVGLSMGGLIAQGLAVKRLDLVRAMVLSNTAAKIGTPQIWADRIAAVRAEGIEGIADAVMQRWFSRRFRETAELKGWRAMLVRTPADGYAGCSAAIAGADFLTPTSGLTLPTLVLAGSEDGSTPPDLVRETADLVRGSRFHLIRGAGHLPPVEAPEDFAAVLAGFLRGIGHV